MADPLDRATLAELLVAVGGDTAFLDEIVGTFRADAPELLAAMESALTAGSPEDLVRPAHTLKGNALTIGAVELAAVARAIEEQARTGDLTDAAPRVAAARAELGRVSTALDATRAAGWNA